MKYKITNDSNNEFDIITEDGGVASVHYNGSSFITTYYQTRLTEIEGEDVWEELAEGKSYSKNWDEKTDKSEIINDSLNWLVVPSPIVWEQDKNLFNHLIK
jgi:hypothetical protein